MTPVLITCLRFLCTWYRARQDEEHSGTRLSENPWIKQWLFIKVVYHSHGQTGWFMVCVHGSQSSGQVNFVPEIAFNICTRQSHLPENGREGLKLRGTQRGYSSKPLNIALLNVFKYLNGRYRHIFIP